MKITRNEYWTEEGRPHVKQWALSLFGYGIMFHKFENDDIGMVAHSHSYGWLLSFVIRGRYVEHVYTRLQGGGWRRRVEERTWINFIRESKRPHPPRIYHVVRKIFGPVYSIVLTGRNVRTMFDYLDFWKMETFSHYYSNPDYPNAKIVSSRLTWRGWI